MILFSNNCIVIGLPQHIITPSTLKNSGRGFFRETPPLRSTALRQSFNSMPRKMSSSSSQIYSLASRSSYGEDSDLIDLDDEAMNYELVDCLKNAAVRILLTLMEFLEHGWFVLLMLLVVIGVLCY